MAVSFVGAPYPYSFGAILDMNWEGLHKRIGSCVASISSHDADVGCGILIGMDRLLVPCHVIENAIASDLKVKFQMDDGWRCHLLTFTCTEFLVHDAERDFCILRLAQDGQNKWPGQYVHMPELSMEDHQGKAILIRPHTFYSQDWVHEGDPCGLQNFCSSVVTQQGHSGSGHFDEFGRLFAMHLTRSSGLCGVTASQRRALYLNEVRSNAWARQFLDLPKNSLTPRTARAIQRAPQVRHNVCFVNEGRPAVNGTTYDANGQPCRYWEQRPRNDTGGGPRGIAITYIIRGKVFFDITPNPHDSRAYNKNATTLYENAAAAYVNHVAANQNVNSSFTFEAYGTTFQATYTGRATVAA